MSETKTTQDFVPIKEIRDGIIIEKDGSLRAVVLVSSLNFALKSAAEQEAIIYQFQNFLNSLDFSVQISIQSRQLDIRPYLEILSKRRTTETNDLLKIQINEYIEFVKNFTENQNIMSKTFFIIIPFTPSIIKDKKTNKFSLAFKKNSPNIMPNETFEENRVQLEQRIGVVQQGLIRCGLKSIRLETEYVIDLFDKLFNPSDREGQVKL